MATSRRELSSFGRKFSHKTSAITKTYKEEDQDHIAGLPQLKDRIVEAGLAIPPALLVNADLDATLLRFLRARKYNVDLAFAMLEKSLRWRAKMGADLILEQPVDAKLTGVVRACRPSSYIGYDRDHHPIFLERLGKLDGRRMEREGVSDDNILAYHLREMEFMAQVVLPEASAAAGRTIDRTVSIMDAQGLTLSALTGFAQRLFRLITAMDSDNYPECCHAIYIVNGGATFGAIWRLVSPFVDKGTRDKVHVIGSGKAMQQVLFDALGPERVPTFLGGSLDYEAVRHQWLEKMDAAIAQRQQQHKGAQPPVVIQPSANGRPQQQQQQQQQQHSLQQHGRSSSSSGGASGRLHWLRLSSGGGADRVSSASGDDGWATPMSTASRFSTTSVASVYFDAQDQEPPSPSGGSPSSTHSGNLDPAHAPFAQHHPEAPGSTAGSMSVGPQSRTRSQLSQQSGFTTATVGQGAQGGPGVSSGGGGMHSDGGAGGSLNDQVLLDDVEEKKQPLCGCRCVIS